MYVYIESEPSLYTVGFYDPSGRWHPDSDHTDSRKAYKTYKAVKREWENVTKLFTSEELEQLQEIN